MRSEKDVAAIEQVQQAVEAAAQAVVAYVATTPEPTAEVAHQIIDETLAAHDCESPEGHIVAGGTQSAEPHETGTGVLETGVPIVIDIYPRSKSTGYFADMTRTVCIGKPSAELQKMYDTVLAAQNLALSMVKPGVRCVEIQQAVEHFFNTAGYLTSGKGTVFTFAEGFVHAVGHGVGKEIHEAPRISRNSEDVLGVGDVITIEPGLYYHHIGGVRLEDMVRVTTAGAQNLTRFPKQLQLATVAHS